MPRARALHQDHVAPAGNGAVPAGGRRVNDARRGLREELAPAAVIENVLPRVDGGRFAAKRVVGEEVVVTADGFSHGHEMVACALRWRGPGQDDWNQAE